MRDRNGAFHSQQRRNGIRGRIDRSGAVDFFNLLTGPELLEMTEALLPEHRERLYPPTQVLAMFIKQALEEDRSCQRAVNAWALCANVTWNTCLLEFTVQGSITHGSSTGIFDEPRSVDFEPGHPVRSP